MHAAFDDLVMAFDEVAGTDLTTVCATDLTRLTDELMTLRRRADALTLRVVHAAACSATSITASCITTGGRRPSSTERSM